MDCIFCQIIEGKIPANKVHDDDDFVAFLDINPITPGHTLVMPKKHHETYSDLPKELAEKLAATAQVVSRGVVKSQNAEGYNLFINNHKCAGQAIPHVHLHIVPRKSNDGVRFNWTPKPYDEGKIEEVEKSIKEALK